MTWTYLAIISIAVIASSVFIGVRLELLERQPIVYTQKQRLAWAVAFAVILTLSGGDWLFGVVLAVAVYSSGPEYHQYRINRQPATHIG